MNKDLIIHELTEQVETLVRRIKNLELEKECLKNVVNTQLKHAHVDGMREVANAQCPVSGYVVTSEESRRQIIEYAEMIKKFLEE